MVTGFSLIRGYCTLMPWHGVSDHNLDKLKLRVVKYSIRNVKMPNSEIPKTIILSVMSCLGLPEFLASC